jgi:two-component system response regulator ResD
MDEPCAGRGNRVVDLKEKRRALVVDDNHSLLRGMSNLLLREGFEVVQAENGDDAIEICKSNRFSVIVCDFNMPLKNGREVFESLREDQKKRFLLWSGSGFSEELGFEESINHMAKDASTQEALERVMLIVNGESP